MAALDRRRWIEHPGRGGCGVGAIADLGGRASRDIVSSALGALRCLEHRGGAIAGTGDGAGVLLSVDRAFFTRFLAPGKRLPEGHALAVGSLFFPLGEGTNLPYFQREIDGIFRRHGLAPLGWRHVPVEPTALGAHEGRRDVWQVLVGEGMVAHEDLPVTLFKAKAAIESRVHDCYVVSLSPSTVVYKALCTGDQLARFYPDLAELSASFALFHRRYSTNTFSNWPLAQLFRVLGHNGEINTIKANRNAVANLEAELGLSKVLMQQGSDSADMDRVVELFSSHGVALPETIARFLPMAWRDIAGAPPELGRFYRGVQRALGSLGAWEGPAAIVACDGRHLVGALDRMGLRPLRWTITRSRRLILGSEAGAIPVPFDDIAETGQLDPGEIISLDLATGLVRRPAEVLEDLLTKTPINFGELSERRLHVLSRRPDETVETRRDHVALNVFGWSWERAKNARHMAEHGKEPITSMGNDRPLAILSALRPPLTKYFKQIVAVVTNPPIDPIREAGAFDLSVHLGMTPTVSEKTNVYDPQPAFRLPSPIVTEEQLWLMSENKTPDQPRALVLDSSFADDAADPLSGAKALAKRIAEIVKEACSAARSGDAAILVLSDRRGVEAGRLPLPMVLAASAVHDAMVTQGLRRKASIVVDTAEIQEGHDVAVFLANGATAVCPWLFYRVGSETGSIANQVRALEECLQRVMSKMGICSVDGYRGSRLFEAVGLGPSLVEHYLPGVVSRLGGLELEDVWEDLRARRALGDKPARESDPSIYRKAVWSELQTTARGHDPAAYGRFLDLIGQTPPVYLRDLLRFVRNGASPHVSGGEVASEREIVASCFRGAAMSHGALHRVAHRAIAAAFNELGAASNCGEGGEDPRRDTNGPWAASRSKIRQVASGRFGVEARYLVHADEIQIKIGQGAKPGEGGMLPAAKVTAEVAAIRKTQAGVALISPPPHHDIYSIEDLAQLVYDLKQVNPRAKISVKIPAVTDIGTIAVGIAKAGADVIDVSGFEGGTGAASSSSIEHAGLPLERGLSEVHQALVVNGIRGRVRLRADGGLKTGYDVASILALGADEVSLGTALMIAEQCIFCHGCANGFCPAGITTQSDLIARRLMTEKKGRPEDAHLDDDDELRYEDAREAVKRYLLALARDLREKLTALGLSHPRELVGRADLLERKPLEDIPGDAFIRSRAAKVDLAEILSIAESPVGAFPLPPGAPQAPAAPRSLPVYAIGHLNSRILDDAHARTKLAYHLSNTDRAVGATLAGAIALGELKGPFELALEGYAGQALGFACLDGLSITLDGIANDSLAEAMGGGQIAVRAPLEGSHSLCGNAAAYGATGGALFVAGRAGQRLGVRNSGATIVAEGAGKYAFEYMTGGVGVVLGPVGSVVASGMTGGVLYLLEQPHLGEKIHPDARGSALDPEDEARLRSLLERHAAATGSRIAKDLLAAGPLAPRFVKILPAAAALPKPAPLPIAAASAG